MELAQFAILCSREMLQSDSEWYELSRYFVLLFTFCPFCTSCWNAIAYNMRDNYLLHKQEHAIHSQTDHTSVLAQEKQSVTQLWLPSQSLPLNFSSRWAFDCESTATIKIGIDQEKLQLKFAMMYFASSLSCIITMAQYLALSSKATETGGTRRKGGAFSFHVNLKKEANLAVLCE